jgi:hypothetical protein
MRAWDAGQGARDLGVRSGRPHGQTPQTDRTWLLRVASAQYQTIASNANARRDARPQVLRKARRIRVPAAPRIHISATIPMKALLVIVAVCELGVMAASDCSVREEMALFATGTMEGSTMAKCHMEDTQVMPVLLTGLYSRCVSSPVTDDDLYWYTVW